MGQLHPSILTASCVIKSQSLNSMVVLAWACGHHRGLWDLICRSPALNSRCIYKSWEPTCLQKSPGHCCAAERLSMFVRLKVVWGLWYISRGTVVASSHWFLASVQEVEGGAVFCLSVFKRHVWAFPYPLWREDRESHFVVWTHWLHRKLECLQFLGFRFLALTNYFEKFSLQGWAMFFPTDWDYNG